MVVSELGLLKIELDSSRLNSAQSSLEAQINKGVDNKEVLLKAFVDTHQENYLGDQSIESKTYSSRSVIDNIKALSGAPSDLFELKKKYGIGNS